MQMNRGKMDRKQEMDVPLKGSDKSNKLGIKLDRER